MVSIDQTGGMYEALDRAGSTKGGTALSRSLWRGLVAVDLLQKALFHVRPRELSAGAADRVYRETLDEVVRCLETDDKAALIRTLSSAREAFAAVRARELNTLPKVGLVGEIYVRHNRFANEEVVRRLENLGAEIMAPPFAEWVFYVGLVNAMRAKRTGAWRKRLAASLTSLVQSLELAKLARS